MADGKIEIETGINTKNLDKGIAGLKQKLSKIGDSSATKSISNIGMAFGGITTAIGAAVGAAKGAISAIQDLTETYKVQAQAETQLTVAARNNPYLNYDSVQNLKAFASEMQGIGTVGDEVLLPLMAQLAASGRKEAEIQDIIAASLDMSASGAMSLDNAVAALNKTYNGNIGLLGQQNGALKSLTTEQLKSGEAVKIIRAQYAGMMKETTDLTGGTQQLANAWGDFKEIVGHGFNMILNPIAKKLAKIVSDINGVISGAEMLDKNASDDDKDRYFIKAAEKQCEDREKIIESYRADELKKAEAYAKKEASVLKRAKVSSYDELSELDRQYLDQYRGEWDKATQKIREEIEKQEELKQRITDAQYRVTGREDSAKRKAEEDEAKRAAEEAARAEQEARDALRAQYDETLRQKGEEIRQRRINGEEISKEAEAQEMYNTAFNAYIKMMSDPAFKGNSGNYEHEVNARKDIAQWGEIGSKSELQKQIKDFEQELQAAADEAAGIVRSHYDTVLEALDAEYKAVIENKYLEEEEKLRIEKEFAEKRGEIVKAKDEAEKAGLQEKISSLTSQNETYWTRYKAKKEEIAEASAEIDQYEADRKKSIQEQYAGDEEGMQAALVALDKETAAMRLEVEKAYSENRKALLAGVMGDVANFTSQTVGIMQDAADLMSETLKNQTDAELDTLEAKYRKGEISAEEYEEKKTEIKKDAAKEQYKIDMATWAASILQATANIALGVTQAIAQGGVAGIITGALVGAAGAVQMASIIASKPVPPSFSTGGIVGGRSYSGDNIAANLNSREMVMNMSQQKGLWDFINGGSNGGGGGASIVINNSASNMVRAHPQVTKDQIEIMIDARVTAGLESGRYGSALNKAQSGMSGEFYGI